MTEIESEYGRHKVPDDIQKKIIDDTYLALNIEDIAKEYFKEEKRLKRLIVKNWIVRHCLNAHSILWTEKTRYEQYLEQDRQYIEEIIEHIEDHEDYLLKILEVLDEKNWQEMLKILDFCVLHYVSNYNFIQGKRKSLEHAFAGIEYIDNRNKDTREEFKTWFEQKIEQNKPEKHLEKKP